MRIPSLLAAAQLRRGWRGYVSLVVLIGVSAGLVLAGLAGAQRTRTAVDRMIDATEPAHLFVNPNDGDQTQLDWVAFAGLLVLLVGITVGSARVASPPGHGLEDGVT